MQVEVKKVDAVRRELKFEISKERVKETFDEVYKDLGKVAKIKGYRPGKAPRHVLEAQHGKTAQDEVVKKIVPQAYQEAISNEKLEPIDMPDIADVNFQDGIITFRAMLDIKPEIKIKDYKGIKVKRKSSEVTDDEIEKTLDYFKQGQGKDKEVEVNDAFAHGLGYPNLEEFKKSLSRQLELDKDRQNRFDLENQIVEELIKKAKLTIPQSMVKKQLEHRVKTEIDRMKSQGIPEEDLQKKETELIKNMQDTVEKDVKVYLILDKIAGEEKIEVKEGENLPAKVIEYLLKEAVWS
ncbi:Cell division trigger factor [hydrothermal vent metagenome]|uniref:peptidylprolyl isomerase n=1 Tax=hydrothermal vent metagenome TaxID=652676 RepID=A0A3B0TAV5_9ZZZZ